MKGVKIVPFLIALVAICLVDPASAAEVLVTDNIAESTTWTADNTYNLQDQIYVLPGATLTIEAGTLVQSTSGLGGSLAVCRGAKIYVNGTAEDPVIMTSTDDDLVNWHEGCNEWGNLTIMGNALISASHYGGDPVGSNTKEPTGLNVKQMEGLTAAYEGDPNVMYGGADDNDDSGALHYLSLRYGGKVIELQNELNGLSMGGIGRATDVDHIEIMNNVDDGIETWGGTVNYKYVSIWNVGDDSFDFDEGWRGKAQFGLIVQGYSTDANQGSGVGDNAFETDGAEDSDAQPVTTACVYNFTVVGQPIDGDQGTAWRDNARVQYRNMIFMDLGEQLIKNDGDDGDGANGYGYNGTLTWEETWATAYTETSSVNAGTWTPGAFNDPAVLYQAQTSGMLAEMTDSVFYGNDHASAYTESDLRGVTVSGGSSMTKNNVVASEMPIQALTRGGMVTRGGKQMLPVTSINPLPANDAVNSVSTAPDDGFFTPAQYRGGFAPDENWLAGWTAADSYGMVEGVGLDFSGGQTHGWQGQFTVGAVTFPTDEGLCLQVPEEGENMGEWFSPDETITLVPDSVWRIDMEVTCDQTTSGSVPLWNMFIDNYDTSAGGPFGYGGTMFVLDNAGSANAAGISRSNFQYWFTPAAVQTDQWTGFDWAGVDGIDDMRLHFRVLDLDSNGINSQADSGMICLQNMTVDRFDLSDLSVEQTFVNMTSIQSDSVTVDAGAAASFNITGGDIEIEPTSPATGFGDSVVTITPGQYTGSEWTNGGPDLLDNVPVPWESNALYRFRAMLQARGGEANPSDIYRLGFDNPTNELMCFSLVTPGLGNPYAEPPILPPGTPRTGSPSEYQMFMYSHSPSASATENFGRLRPRIDILNTERVVLGGVSNATDGYEIQSVVVEKVSFPEM